MNERDLPALRRILQDADVMYAYGHAFSDAEVEEWFNRQLDRYGQYAHKYGLWAAVLKENNEMIGQCGLTMQEYNGGFVMEIGYLFQKAYWHNGYALEGAVACKKYAFDILNEPEVYSIIRDTNIASQKVAERNGMTVKDKFVKRYYNTDMPHIVYSVKNNNKNTAEAF